MQAKWRRERKEEEEAAGMCPAHLVQSLLASCGNNKLTVD